MEKLEKWLAPVASIIGFVLLVVQLIDAFSGARTLVTSLLVLFSVGAIGAGMWHYAFARSTIREFHLYKWHWIAKIVLVVTFLIGLTDVVFILTFLKVVPDCCRLIPTETATPTSTLSPTPSFTPTNSPRLPTLTPTPSPENIGFVSTDQPDTLNPSLQWEAGSSELSSYILTRETLTITAGPHTWPNFPMLNYLRPITGNLSVQVTVIFTPAASVVDTAQMVGVLVRPVNARLVQSDASFPQDWLATSKYVTDQGILVGCRGAWSPYSANAVSLAIERQDNSWRCGYSPNGVNWIWNDASVDSKQLQDKQVLISLFAYSDTEKAITVEFSNWVILENDR